MRSASTLQTRACLSCAAPSRAGSLPHIEDRENRGGATEQQVVAAKDFRLSAVTQPIDEHCVTDECIDGLRATSQIRASYWRSGAGSPRTAPSSREEAFAR